MRAYNLLAPQPGTLWFMSMLMFFYLVTPFIQYGKNPKIKILNATVLLLIMLLWGQVATIDAVYSSTI